MYSINKMYSSLIQLVKSTRRYTQFLSGIVTALVLVTIVASMASFAATGSIVASLSDIKVYVDNQLLTLKDDNGNVLQPIVYNGRTYLPAKAISEAINKPVTWEAKTRSFYIGKNDLGKPSTYLTDLDAFFSSGTFYQVYDKDAFDNLGNSYDASKTLFYADSSDVGNTVYNIDGKYSMLKGVYFITSFGRDTKYNYMAKIYGDGELLWSATITGGVKPVDFSIDISGYNQIKIELDDTTSPGWNPPSYALANLGLYP